MPFALANDPSQSEISEAINYLLANFGPNLSADPNTGQITGPSGIVIAYLYRYLSVKYADSFDGSLNFSNTPTNRGYYGVNNSNSTTESTNPSDYIWYKVAGGFGTTKFLFYQCTGGRSINFVIATTAPSDSYIQDAGTAIDLDILTSGAKANSATTAYLVQSQSSPAPSGFPLYTSGSSLPPGWSATIGTVAVGQVVWYSFGQYNGSTSTVNGIPANSTYWSTPVAASVFQDIRSDNWNGSTPPTYGVPSSYGTVGYYISRSTGNVWFNNGIFRGDITGASGIFSGDVTTQGQGKFYGINGSAFNIAYNGSPVSVYYSVWGDTPLTGGSGANTGVFGLATSLNGTANIGVTGVGYTEGAVPGIGVYGQGGLWAVYANGSIAITNSGTLYFNGTTIQSPSGSSTDYLRGNGTWGGVGYATTAGTATTATTATDSNALGGFAPASWARIFVGNTGTANASGAGMNFSCLITGYQFRGASNYMYLEPVSDRRLKENIQPETLGLDFINALKPVTYHMIGQERKAHGFIAQDVESLITETNDSLKIENSEGVKGVDYLSLIAPLTKAIQELSAEVEALKAQLKV